MSLSPPTTRPSAWSSSTAIALPLASCTQNASRCNISRELRSTSDGIDETDELDKPDEPWGADATPYCDKSSVPSSHGCGTSCAGSPGSSWSCNTAAPNSLFWSVAISVTSPRSPARYTPDSTCALLIPPRVDLTCAAFRRISRISELARETMKYSASVDEVSM
eukprot:2741439-Pleurochrysis_carterae.AAC.2